MALADLIVVMHQGRLEQCGAPREVYNQPGEQRFVIPASDLAVGHDVTFAIRNDKVTLIPAALSPGAATKTEVPSLLTARHNTVLATVHSVAYQGAWVQLTLETPASEEFAVALNDSTFFEACGRGESCRSHLGC